MINIKSRNNTKSVVNEYLLIKMHNIYYTFYNNNLHLIYYRIL